MKTEFFSIYYFPKKMLPFLYKALAPASKLGFNARLEKVVDRDSETFTEVILECGSVSDVMLVGMYIGNKEVAEAIQAALPQMKENIRNLVETIKTPSDN